MGFAGKVARDLDISEQQFWTASACGLMGYLQFDELVERGIIPFQGDYCLIINFLSLFF